MVFTAAPASLAFLYPGTGLESSPRLRPNWFLWLNNSSEIFPQVIRSKPFFVRFKVTIPDGNATLNSRQSGEGSSSGKVSWPSAILKDPFGANWSKAERIRVQSRLGAKIDSSIPMRFVLMLRKRPCWP